MKKADMELVSKFRSALRKFEREQEYLQRSKCCKGLTLAQCHALLEIGKLEQPSLMRLSESLSLDKSTVSRTVDALTNLDLVDRYVPFEDRRTVLISLTKTGKDTYDDINYENDTYYTRVLEAIPARERNFFVSTFELLADTMSGVNRKHEKEAAA